jgi:adenine-specific DNA-methyltransferase
MGDHAVTHCQPRLEKVIDCEQGGISKAVNWQGGGGFRFYRLGDTVFDEHGQIQTNIGYGALASHIWFSETATPLDPERRKSLFLGQHNSTGYALLYNGILGDKSAKGGNVLTRTTLDLIRAEAGDFDGPMIVYGERAAFGAATLEREGITFKQTPYDVKARR